MKLNIKGYSLVELMVTLAVVSIMSMGAFAGLSALKGYYLSTMHKLETEQEYIALSAALQSVFRKASSVVYNDAYNAALNPSVDGTVSNRSRGVIFRTDESTAFDGDVRLISLFNADFHYNANPSFSDMRSVGIFFQSPTATRSGAVYIDQERVVGGNSAVSPAQGAGVSEPVKFGRITEFEVTNIRVLGTQGNIINIDSAVGNGAANNLPVLSFEVRVRMRYFLGGHPRNDWRWCPWTVANAANGQCRGNAGFNDVDKIIKISLNNNINPNAGGANRHRYARTNGNLYFYNLYTPRSYR